MKESNRQIAKRHYQNFRRYIEERKRSEEGFPVRNGRFNRTQMAKDCNFDRGVFVQNPQVKKLFEELERSEFPEQTTTQTKDDFYIRRLEKELESTRQRLIEAEARNEELQQRLEKFSLFEEHMINTGRRIIP